MKYWKKYRSLLILGVIACTVAAFFHVPGRAIVHVSDISDDCTVMIEKYQILEYEDRVEYTLDSQQIQQLKELLLDSNFTRMWATAVYSDERDMYDIRIDFNDGQRFLLIHCFANEYITVTDQFDGKHLKINNPDWKTALEAILVQ